MGELYTYRFEEQQGKLGKVNLVPALEERNQKEENKKRSREDKSVIDAKDTGVQQGPLEIVVGSYKRYGPATPSGLVS